jgi:hypothetical protein
MLIAFFMLKLSFINNLCCKKSVKTLKVEFIKRLWMDRLLEFIALGLRLRKVGPGIFCTTIHRHILLALSLSFWQNVIPFTLPPWFSAGWLFYCDERDKVQLFHISSGLWWENWRRYRHSVYCMNDVNIVPLWAETVLSEDINKYLSFWRNLFSCSPGTQLSRSVCLVCIKVCTFAEISY